MTQRSRLFLLRRCSNAGVTLVEMLVALVILGFVLTLVSQAVSQVTQLVRAAENATREVTEGWSGASVVRAAIANLALPMERSKDAFKGTTTTVEGFTTLALDGAAQGVQAMRLEIKRSEVDDGSAIWASSGEGQAQKVAQLAGRYEFAYLDSQGTLVSAWPQVVTAAAAPGSVAATQAPDEALPAALVLREVGSGRAVLWVAVQGERLRPKPSTKPFWETL